MKQIRQTVNIFFSVPDDYEVTDAEYLDNLSADLHDINGRFVSNFTRNYESIETIDLEDLGDA